VSLDQIVQITALTHQGRVRQNNEDSILVGNWVRNAPMSKIHQWRLALEDPVVCLIADGMGGHAAGEVASQHVASRISVALPNFINTDNINTTLHEINAELYDLMARKPSCVGMGTTVVGIVFFQNKSIWFNVGDSRLYQRNKGHLRQISIDDVPDSVKGHVSGQGRQSHAITQSLGGTKTIQPLAPHMGVNDLAVPSRWLLCSDGLTDMVDIDAMEKCMEDEDLEAVFELFDLAMGAGGEDNLSIIVASINEIDTGMT
jgi:PPM family protein phosphatase